MIVRFLYLRTAFRSLNLFLSIFFLCNQVTGRAINFERFWVRKILQRAECLMFAVFILMKIDLRLGFMMIFIAHFLLLAE